MILRPTQRENDPGLGLMFSPLPLLKASQYMGWITLENEYDINKLRIFTKKKKKKTIAVTLVAWVSSFDDCGFLSEDICLDRPCFRVVVSCITYLLRRSEAARMMTKSTTRILLSNTPIDNRGISPILWGFGGFVFIPYGSVIYTKHGI